MFRKNANAHNVTDHETVKNRSVDGVTKLDSTRSTRKRTRRANGRLRRLRRLWRIWRERQSRYTITSASASTRKPLWRSTRRARGEPRFVLPEHHEQAAVRRVRRGGFRDALVSSVVARPRHDRRGWGNGTDPRGAEGIIVLNLNSYAAARACGTRGERHAQETFSARFAFRRGPDTRWCDPEDDDSRLEESSKKKNETETPDGNPSLRENPNATTVYWTSSPCTARSISGSSPSVRTDRCV